MIQMMIFGTYSKNYFYLWQNVISLQNVHMFENLNDGEHRFTDDKVFIFLGCH